MDSYIPVYLRNQNRNVVFNLFINNNQLSRAEISRISNISKPTVTKIVDYFLEMGIIEETESDGSIQNGVGRKCQTLHLNEDKFSVIGIYYEGNYLNIGLINLRGKIMDQHFFPFFGEADTEAQFAHVNKNLQGSISLFQHSHPDTNILGIGIGLPAIIDERSETISRRNTASSPGYYRPFSDYKNITDIPVYIENDMNAASFGELLLRQDNDLHNLFYLSLGTGFGSGIIINKKIWHGDNFFAGDIGSIIDGNGLGSSALTPEEMRLEKKINIYGIREKFGVDITAETPCSPETRKEISSYLSSYLTPLIYNLNYIFDIQNFVLAGILVDFVKEYIFDDINHNIRMLESKDSMNLKKLITPSISSDAGIVGAAAIALEHCLPDLLN